MKVKRRVCQCGSCENVFLKAPNEHECKHCGSGNWVYGYIDLPMPKWREKELRKLQAEGKR